MAEPIEIIIRKGTGGDATGFGIPGATPGGPSAAALKRGAGFGKEMKGITDKTTADKFNAMVIAFGLSQMKKAMYYGLSQYANMTGNYIQQAELQEGLGLVTEIAGIGMGIATAAAVNPILGAFTAGISIAGKAIDIGFQRWTLRTDITKLNTYANIMQERSGGTFSNGSRGTDY